MTGTPHRAANGSGAGADGRPARPANRVRLGSVLGFEVDIDHSWFIIFFLVFWSLSQAIFPEAAPDLSPGTYVAMGFVGTVLFFASLLAHELSHALVSRARSIDIEGITLYVFGGMARTSREPDTPRDEMLIAGVGPLSSLAIAALFRMCSLMSVRVGAGPQVVAVADYLAVINLALAIFNMMPGFPLDGGRVFRAITWGVTGDRTKATRWATEAGRWFGTLLMVLGAVQALTGAPLGGLWLAFIGWFLRSLARASFQQHVLHDLLQGYAASDLMTPDPQVIQASVPLEGLVDDRFLRLRYGGYPVLDGDSLVGVVTLENVKNVPRREWASATVRDAMTPVSECAVVAPSAAVPEVLEAMSHHPACGRALVVGEGGLVGIISASDIARWVQRAQWMEHVGRHRGVASPPAGVGP